MEWTTGMMEWKFFKSWLSNFKGTNPLFSFSCLIIMCLMKSVSTHLTLQLPIDLTPNMFIKIVGNIKTYADLWIFHDILIVHLGAHIYTTSYSWLLWLTLCIFCAVYFMLKHTVCKIRCTVQHMRYHINA